MAESIVAALENNPEETLQTLAKSFNVGDLLMLQTPQIGKS